MKNKLFLLMLLTFCLSFFYLGCNNPLGSDSSSSNTTDTTPPAEVSNLSVTAGDKEVELSWLNPSDNDFDHCEIWYTTDTTTNTQFNGTIDPQNTVIDGLTNNDEYTFNVITVDTNGNKSSGTTIKATPADTTAPQDVENLNPTPLDAQIKLSWTYTEPSDFDHFEITWTPEDGESQPKSVESGNQETTITSLINGKEYDFTVQTVDTNGNISAGVTIKATPTNLKDISDFGTKDVFKSTTIDDPIVRKIDENRFLLVYDNLGSGYAKVATIDNNGTITYGTEYSFDSNSKIFDVILLDTSNFVILYNDNYINQSLKLLTGEISSNDTIQFSDTVITTLMTNDTSRKPENHANLTAIDSNHFMVVHSYWNDQVSGNGVYYSSSGYAKVYTLEGDGSHTHETTHSYYSEGNYSSYRIPEWTEVVKLSNSKYVVIYKDVNDGYKGKSKILNLNTADWSMTSGTENTFCSNTLSNSTTVVLDQDHIVTSYSYSDGNYNSVSKIGTISGDSITYSPEYSFNTGLSENCASVSIDESNFIVAYKDTDNSSIGTGIVGNVDLSTSSISFNTEKEFNSASTGGIDIDTMSPQKAVFAFCDEGNNSYGTLSIGNISLKQ